MDRFGGRVATVRMAVALCLVAFAATGAHADSQAVRDCVEANMITWVGPAHRGRT